MKKKIVSLLLGVMMLSLTACSGVVKIGDETIKFSGEVIETENATENENTSETETDSDNVTQETESMGIIESETINVTEVESEVLSTESIESETEQESNETSDKDDYWKYRYAKILKEYTINKTFTIKNIKCDFNLIEEVEIKKIHIDEEDKGIIEKYLVVSLKTTKEEGKYGTLNRAENVKCYVNGVRCDDEYIGVRESIIEDYDVVADLKAGESVTFIKCFKIPYDAKKIEFSYKPGVGTNCVYEGDEKNAEKFTLYEIEDIPKEKMFINVDGTELKEDPFTESKTISTLNSGEEVTVEGIVRVAKGEECFWYKTSNGFINAAYLNN